MSFSEPTKETVYYKESEKGLHPFRKGISDTEPIKTFSQSLTPTQKEHLEDTSHDRSKLIHHLAGAHGQVFPDLKESELAHPIDPQVRQRFGLPDRPIISNQTLQYRHLQEHIENIAEKESTIKADKDLKTLPRGTLAMELKERKRFENAGTRSMERMK